MNESYLILLHTTKYNAIDAWLSDRRHGKDWNDTDGKQIVVHWLANLFRTDCWSKCTNNIKDEIAEWGDCKNRDEVVSMYNETNDMLNDGEFNEYKEIA